jgi:hypothetical protein
MNGTICDFIPFLIAFNHFVTCNNESEILIFPILIFLADKYGVVFINVIKELTFFI